MRPRAKRDLSILFGVLGVVAGVFFINYNFQRTNLWERMEALRTTVEQQREAQGTRLLKWALLRQTKGTVRSGPTFDTRLLEYDQKTVNLIGFMVPLEQFRDVTEFILLPVPIECYFCQMPPLRDVVLVHMKPGSTSGLYKEPVMVQGTLMLHQGPNTKFFYTLENAIVEAGKRGGSLTRKTIAPQHMIPQHPVQQEPLYPGAEPPQAAPDTNQP
jgi:hypothetical protein